MTVPHDTPARHAADRIVRALRDAGHVAYFAGGCVRDELLGLTPSDYDVATDAVPDRVQHLFPRSSEVGKSFGVVIVNIGREVVEVATFRSDGTYTDKRRPDTVHFSSPTEDAQRRDFTVNALFLDPLGTPVPGQTASPLGGLVIDLVDGLADLSARILRAVGDPEARLAEDHLRALRAVRLTAKLGFEIEPGTALAIRRHAAELKGVSRERIGDEIERMLIHASRARAAALLAELGLIEPVLLARPGAADLRRLRELRTDATYAAALTAWALDLGLSLEEPAITECLARWRRALCLSNDHRDAIAAALRQLVTLTGPWNSLAVAGQKRLAAAPGFQDALAVLRAETPDRAIAVEHRVDELAATPSGLAPPPYLTGDDLVAIGFTPGPRFKTLLDAVYDAQLEGRVTNSDQARELARKSGV